MFAKLYNTMKYGQILVKLDETDSGLPEIRFYVQPEGLGVCSSAVFFKDSKEGEDKAIASFNEITEETAINTVEKTMSFAFDQ